MNYEPLRRFTRYYYLKMVKEKGSPDYIARGWAIGMFINWMIPIGAQMLFSVPLSFILKGSKIGAVVGTMVTNPVTIVFLYPLQCYIGNLLTGGSLSMEFFRGALRQVFHEQSFESVWRLSSEVLTSFFVGGLFLAVITTPLAYFFIRLLVNRYRALRVSRWAKKEQKSRQTPLVLLADRPAAHYRVHEKIRFAVSAQCPPGAEIAYRISEWNLPVAAGRVAASEHPIPLETQLDHPGFLLAKVEIATGTGPLTAGCGVAVEPEKLRPLLAEPADFDRFWQDGLARQQGCPPVTLEPIPEASGEAYASYWVKSPTIDGGAIYGFLVIPAGGGPFPLLAEVPGAGPGFCEPDIGTAKTGVISLRMNIHPFRPPLGDPAALKKQFDDCYGERWFLQQNTTDPEAYIYRRSHLAVSRAIDFAATLPEFDRTHLVASGVSQGGTYAVTMAALNPRVTAAAALVPGFGDHGGFLAGRGKSHILLPSLDFPEQKEAMIRTAGYFESAFFARRINVPTLFAAGFIDEVCTPGSVYAIYNEVAAPKEMIDMPGTGHAPSPAAIARRDRWVAQYLKS
jgi:hypothetical protein